MCNIPGGTPVLPRHLRLFNTLRYFYCTGAPTQGYVKLWRVDDRFLSAKNVVRSWRDAPSVGERMNMVLDQSIMVLPRKINVSFDNPRVGRPVCKAKAFPISENVTFHCQHCTTTTVGRPYDNE